MVVQGSHGMVFITDGLCMVATVMCCILYLLRGATPSVVCLFVFLFLSPGYSGLVIFSEKFL